MAEELNQSLEYTPTWIVAVVCSIIVFISLIVERGLHGLGKVEANKHLKRNKQNALYDALLKLQEGFISLLLTVTQNIISDICMPPKLATQMLPCKRPHGSSEGSTHELIYYDNIINRRRLFSEDNGFQRCREKGKVPLLSLEALHHLHIFIFVLAVVHAVFCVTTMLLGGARIRQWKTWEDDIRKRKLESIDDYHHHEFFKKHADGFWRRAAVVGWLISFFKQFYGSVTESDYIALRQGFIKILLLVGAKLEHIIARLAQESVEKMAERNLATQVVGNLGRRKEHDVKRVKPSDEYFWFRRPALVLDLLHFTLFQNSFEIAFFFWIWCTYGFDSCIMEKIGYIIPRLIMGLIVQVLCSYSTLPLYTLVTQMGSRFKKGMFDEVVESSILSWAGNSRGETEDESSEGTKRTMSHRMIKESTQQDQIGGQAIIMVEDETTSTIELSTLTV
ncbi:hypothetical protein RIF29_40927 [Crotalaria pallida]|uniref:MLO-like protein n=1 Tax=Crotalaria pallida TaxID=3830 RepID=A0AAN9E4E5_CROPI